MKIKFLRRNTTKHLKLGKKRTKQQKWRNPTGRHNKMRNKRKGYPAKVEIGYKKNREKETPVVVNNVDELQKNKKSLIIIGKVGRKKRVEIAEKAKEMKISIQNLNIEKFLNKVKGNKKEK